MMLHSLQTSCYLLRKMPLSPAITEKMLLMTECTGSATTSYGTVEFGKLEKMKYSVNHESAEKGVLTVISLESADNALYLCAVSEHSAAESFHRSTKTLFDKSYKRSHRQVALMLNTCSLPQCSLIEGLRSLCIS